jgi:microcompartment protein CcmL/EutN
MWEVVKRIIIQRKKKELEPILRILNEVSDVDETNQDAEEFIKIIKELEAYSTKVDNTLDTLIKADSNWFVGTFMKMIK